MHGILTLSRELLFFEFYRVSVEEQYESMCRHYVQIIGVNFLKNILVNDLLYFLTKIMPNQYLRHFFPHIMYVDIYYRYNLFILISTKRFVFVYKTPNRLLLSTIDLQGLRDHSYN